MIGSLAPTTEQHSQAEYQPVLDELVAFASAEPRKADLLDAKKHYFELTGEIFEDDKQFEMRMASFLDWYLFDRPSPLTGKTPAVEFYEKQIGTERANAFRSFTETVHGLFEVRKIKKTLVRLRELHSGKDFDVTERRQLAGLEKGDVIEARLIPWGGDLFFSVAFCFHPKGSFKAIIKEAKRRKKKEPQRSPKELVFEAAQRALKVDRYRQISVERIYDFEQKVI